MEMEQFEEKIVKGVLTVKDIEAEPQHAIDLLAKHYVVEPKFHHDEEEFHDAVKVSVLEMNHWVDKLQNITDQKMRKSQVVERLWHLRNDVELHVLLVDTLKSLQNREGSPMDALMKMMLKDVLRKKLGGSDEF
ncbi:MAG: hypothetical protein DRJ03_27145 [Chloroflexi bacterium]|nr:MAG: hypothetical protein DRJ03_27145 [Chloroflexota bacterium]